MATITVVALLSGCAEVRRTNHAIKVCGTTWNTGAESVLPFKPELGAGSEEHPPPPSQTSLPPVNESLAATTFVVLSNDCDHGATVSIVGSTTVNAVARARDSGVLALALTPHGPLTIDAWTGSSYLGRVSIDG